MFNTLNVRGQGLLTGQGDQSHDFVYLFHNGIYLIIGGEILIFIHLCTGKRFQKDVC